MYCNFNNYFMQLFIKKVPVNPAAGISNIAVIDDHVLLRKGLCELLVGFGKYNVLFEADNGKDLTTKLDPDNMPEIVLMDINMPEMDGYAATLWLKNRYPSVKVLGLSMYDNETSVIRMLKAGARGYILKDCDPMELKEALFSILTKGYYYSEMITGKLINSINKSDDIEDDFKDPNHLNEREITFLKLVCTEMTYKEIAQKMCLSPRTIDGYRDALFEKLNVKTRVGLVLYAIKNGIVILD